MKVGQCLGRGSVACCHWRPHLHITPHNEKWVQVSLHCDVLVRGSVAARWSTNIQYIKIGQCIFWQILRYVDKRIQRQNQLGGSMYAQCFIFTHSCFISILGDFKWIMSQWSRDPLIGSAGFYLLLQGCMLKCPPCGCISRFGCWQLTVEAAVKWWHLEGCWDKTVEQAHLVFLVFLRESGKKMSDIKYNKLFTFNWQCT